MFSKKVKKELREFLIIFLGFGIFTAFIGSPCYVPSGSMRDELRVGDVVFMHKLCFPGPRLPRILSVPFTEKTIWGTSISSYLPFSILPYFRLGFLGFSSLKRGDVFVFNAPHEHEYPTEIKTRYVKQLKALPGDTIEIIEGTVYINGAPEPAVNRKKVMLRYLVTTRQTVSRRFFTKYNISKYDATYASSGFYLYATQEMLDKIEKDPLVDKIEKAPLPQRLLYNMPPKRVPYKGMTIKISSETCKMYGNIIRYHEGHSDVSIKDNVLLINRKKIKEYTFQQNYYFAMGKNYWRSYDSRDWGFVPESHVEGKAVFIILGAREGIEPGEQWYRKIWLLGLLKGNFTWARSFTSIGAASS